MNNLTIYVDSREPLHIATALSYLHENIEIRIMATSDYSDNTGMCGIERKSLSDFFNFNDVKAKIYELSLAYKHAFLFVEGSYETYKQELKSHRKLTEEHLTGFVASLCVSGFPPVFIEDPKDMAKIIYKTIIKSNDGKNRNENYTPIRPLATNKDVSESIISMFPGIGKERAEMLYTKFGSIKNFVNASKEQLIEVEGIGQKLAEQIIDTINH